MPLTKKTKEATVKNASGLEADPLYLLVEKEHFIRDIVMHPHFRSVLASDRQLQDLNIFCADPKMFMTFCADPTFDIFMYKLSLTVTTYRKLC